MDCRETRQLLSAYMDGQLENNQHEDVLAHLEICESCRTELEELRETVSLLRRLPELSPPPEFKNHLRHRIAAEIENKPVRTGVSPFFKRRAQIIAVAAVICLTAGLTALWQNFSPPWDKKEMVQNVSEDDSAIEYPVGRESGPAPEMAGNDKGQEARETIIPADTGVPDSGEINSPGGEQVDSSRQNKGAEVDEVGAVPENRGSPSRSPGTGQEEVTMMSVPPSENGSAGGQEVSPSLDQKQELLMAPPGLGGASAKGANIDKSGTIHVTTLTLGTSDLKEAKEKIKLTAEKHNVMVINEKEKSVTLVCSEQDFESILTEINKVGSVLNRQSLDRNVNTSYNDICSQLTRLYAEEQQLAQKRELTSVDNELLKETKTKIEDYEKQLQQMDSMVNKNVVEISLKPF